MEDAASLRSRLVSGFAWNVSATVAMQCSQIAVALVLVRLLTPRDYGVAGMALVFSSLVLVLSDLSLGAGLVQRRDLTEKDRSTVFWTSAGIGLLLTAAGIGLAGPLATFYGEPSVAPLFAVLSVSFLFKSLETTQASVLQRELRFRINSLRVTAGATAGGAAGLTLAVLGFGPWALIGQQVTVSFVSMALLWIFSPWRPSLTYSWASLRDLGGFGLKLFGAHLLDYLHRNADKLLIGRFLGSASLGAYAVAYNLMVLPLQRLVIPIQDTLFPAYSRWQDDPERLRRVWFRVSRVVAAVVAPTMLGLVVVAQDFVHVMLGERWAAAAPVLQALAFVALVQSVSGLGGKVLEALGRAGVVLRFAALQAAVMLPAFVIGLRWGIVGVAAAYAAASLPVSAVLCWLTAREVGTSASVLLANLAGVLQASLTMAVVCWLARGALVQAGVPAGLRLPAIVALGVVVYLPLCGWRAPEVRDELRSLRGRRSRRELAVVG